MAAPATDPPNAAAVESLLKAMEVSDDEDSSDHEDDKPSTGKKSRGPYTGYNDAISSAVSYLAEPPRMVMGAVEILTWFPNTMQWPDAFFRLLRNGWKIGDIATAQVYARGALTKEDLGKRNAAMRKQIKTAGNEKLGVEDFTQRAYKDHVELQEFTAANFNYDTTGWSPPHGKPLANNPPTLYDVSNGVINWPQGEDRGIFTKVMEWAKANNTLHAYTIRDVMRIANDPANSIEGQPAEAQTHEWDQGGWDRTREIPKPWYRGG